jgi:hypothetical protein
LALVAMIPLLDSNEVWLFDTAVLFVELLCGAPLPPHTHTHAHVSSTKQATHGWLARLCCV